VADAHAVANLGADEAASLGEGGERGLFLVLAAVTCGGRSELSSGVTRATGSGGASATGSGGATGTGGGGGGAGPSSSMSTSMDCVGTGQSCTTG